MATAASQESPGYRQTRAGQGREAAATASTAADSLVIAVDGPSGSGKSSAARGVAALLRLRYLDTGAMYRAVTWWMLEHQIDLTDADSVVKHGLGLPIEVGTDPDAQFTKIDGVDVTSQIRDRRVSNAVSLVAAIPRIRGHLIAMQQEIIRAAQAQTGGIVAEGRDIGTVVAPDAAVKVFLTASEQARAERRSTELAGAEPVAEHADLTRREQARRDQLDAPQTQRAADAVEIDATELALSDVIALIARLAGSRRANS
jgi:CMP/dCMP kinase